MSEAEPELGIGFVRDQDHQSVTLEFPVAAQTRRYGKKTAPLKRLEFRVGETLQSASGSQLKIERVEDRSGLLWYIGADSAELCESEVSPKLKLQRPLERFLAGHWDPLKAYDLRAWTLELWHRHLNSPARGLIGAKAQLLPHQLYVAHEVSSRGLPRALLADEVGLGKTIEAGWIIHRLIATARARRVLVLVPGALVNQWFIELFKRFNLSFWVPDSQSLDAIQAEDLASQERVILGIESLEQLKRDGVLDGQSWDMVVVDEAHRISWMPDAPSAEYRILEGLAAQSRGLLLLTATPEQLGAEGHFARLRLIDPVRFPSLERYLDEHANYQEIARLAEHLLAGKPVPKKVGLLLESKLKGRVDDELLQDLSLEASRKSVLAALNDHFGTGRIYFRNSRTVVEVEHCFFPKRILKRHPIEIPKGTTGWKARIQWLGEFAKAHKTEKTLLICSSADQVIEWERKLRDEFAIKAVAFHENLPLLARDRNAAYFEDPEGATILLSSEIGGEGRNFQHARHLVLADLPEDPDVLEQRIGRLDRIGQASDIQIHVPFSKGCREEHLLRWHHEVFNAFEAPAKGAASVYETHRSALAVVTDESLEGLLERAKAEYRETLDRIEGGRDRLIELNSFDAPEGARITAQLADAERSIELGEYLEQVFDTLGVHFEDLSQDSHFVEPGDGMFVSHFPALPPEGISFTYSRKKSLARNDLAFMSWDHPLVTGTMEALAGQETGNISVSGGSEPLLLLECQFVLEPVTVESSWYGDEFLPPQSIRVVLDSSGRNVTPEWPKEKLRAALSPLSPVAQQLARKIPGEKLRAVLERASSLAERPASELKNAALDRLRSQTGAEISRLQALREQNGLVSAAEIDWWTDRVRFLESAFGDARTRLDSFLIVIPNRPGG